MRWISWASRLGRRKRPERRPQNLESFRPRIYRLEDRRVLDVGAAFSTATGQLHLLLTNTADAASITVTNGNIVITDSQQQQIDIDVDGNGPAVVNASAVDSIHVQGDAAPDQTVLFQSPLALPNGLTIDAAVERAEFHAEISRVDAGPIEISAATTLLAADLVTDGQDITFHGDVRLADSVTLTGRDVRFLGSVDDDGSTATESHLRVQASRLTRFAAPVGQIAPLTRIETDAPGETSLQGAITVTGDVAFHDAVLLLGDTAVHATGNTGIRFGQTIDSLAASEFSLTATATAGSVEFFGDIGAGGAGDQQLGSLTVTEADQGVLFGDAVPLTEIRLAGSLDLGLGTNVIGGQGILWGSGGQLVSVQTGGTIRLNGAVSLGADLVLETQGGNITFTADAPIDSEGNRSSSLTLNAASGSVFLNADVGGSIPVRGFVVTRADGGVVFGEADTKTRGSTGPLQRIQSVERIAVGDAGNVILGGVRINAGADGVLEVVTTNDAVVFNGSLVLESGLSISTGAGAGDIDFLTGTIDSVAAENNDLTLDAGVGTIRFNNHIGSIQPLGDFTVTRASGGVLFGNAATPGGGMGPVNQVTAVGAIELGSGDQEVGGAGIVFQATPGQDFTITSSGGDIRVNGAVTLASDLRIEAGGDILFTNDAPIDSRPGELHSLTVTAAAGTVAFNEDLGRTTPLRELIVVQAGEGLFLGQATNEVPGSGALGPVEIVRLDGLLDLGVGTNGIGGAGIVLTGSAIAPQRISTTDDTLRFNGAVTLQTDVELTTGLSGADILFTNTAAIDSGLARTSSLTIDAGSGRVSFNENLGETRSLGRLTIEQADAGVTFGTADAEQAGAGGTGPVQLVRVDQPIQIGVGANVIGGTGIVFNAGDDTFRIETTADLVRLNGAVRLQSDLQIVTGAAGGDVFFTSAATIDSDDGPAANTAVERHDLLIDAGTGSVIFNGDVGAQQRLNTLVVESAAGGVVFGNADVATVGGSGPVAQVLTEGEIDLGRGNSPADVLGPVIFNAGTAGFVLHALTGDVRINGPVSLHSDLQLDVGAGNLVLTSSATVDSQASEFRNLTLSVSGNASFHALIGSTHRLGNLLVESVEDLTFDRAVMVQRLVQESGSGLTLFRGSLQTSHATQPGIDLTGANFRFEAPVLATGDGRVSIRHTGLLDILAAADFRLDGAFQQLGGGEIHLAGDIATSGDTITLTDPLILTTGGGQVLLSTVAGGAAAGADIRLSAVDGEVAGSDSLLLNAGEAGNIEFAGAVGGSQSLAIVTVVNARDVQFEQSLQALRFLQIGGEGRTTFMGEVQVGHATLRALDITTRDLQFLASVTTSGQGSVRFDLLGELDLSPAADFALNGSFTQLGPAIVLASADIVTSADDVYFAGELRLREDVRIDTGSGTGTIRFEQAINSHTIDLRSLSLHAGLGDIVLVGEVGTTFTLNRLFIEDARDVQLQSDVRVGGLEQQAGSGTTTLLGLVATSSADGIQLTSNELVVEGTLSSAVGGDVVLNAAASVRVRGSIVTAGQLVDIDAGQDIELGSGAVVRTLSGPITLRADSDQLSGGAILAADGSLVDSGTAALIAGATDSITVGRFVSAEEIRLHSTQGAILDGGDANGFDLDSPRLHLRAAQGIGTAATGNGKDAEVANPLETRTRFVAAENSVSGGIYLFNRDAGTLTIAAIDGLVGLRNLGEGNIEVTNQGTLLVDNPVFSNGGGDTRLRADSPGDLVVNQPIQNVGGDGSIFLFAAGDLVLHNSLPEPPGLMENPPNPEQHFELMVSGEGAIRGEAGGEVLVDDGDTDFVIIRTATGQITNVLPILSIRTIDQGGSDIDEQGRGFVEVKIGDKVHLETNFHVQIDWGDGEIESYPIPGTIHPERLPGNTDPRFISGDFGMFGTREPGVYIFSHKYFSHPNPDDPAAPIPIRVELRTDARASGEASIDDNRPQDASAIFNGIRFVNNVSNVIFTTQDAAFSVPGTGNFAFVKVVESVIVPVEIRTTIPPPPVQATVSFTNSGGLRTDFRTTRFESQTQVEYRLFLRVVDDVAKAEVGEPIELDLDWLNDPLALFRSRRFPNGHYRIYLEDVRTRRVRLILDVHIFDGRVVPEDFRENAGEKQPGADDPQAEAANPQAILGAGMSMETARAAHTALTESSFAVADAAPNTAVESFPSMTRVARLLRKVRFLDAIDPADQSVGSDSNW